MFFPKTVVALAALFVGVSSRYVYREDYFQPIYVLEETNIAKDRDDLSERYFETVQPNYVRLARSAEEANADLPAYYLNLEDIEAESPSYEVQQSHRRLARQAQGQATLHIPDKTLDISGAARLAGNDKNTLSAIGGVQGIKPDGSFGSIGAGLSLDNAKGHSLTAMGTHIPNIGNQLSAAGKLNLVNTPDHKLDANAFASKTFSSTPQLPNFNTYGGNLDYMYKGKVGATLGATRYPSFDRTDYSAMGKLNLMRTPSSSLDLSSGVTRMNTPFFSRTEPRFDLTWSKSW